MSKMIKPKVERYPVERALYALTMDNPRRAKQWLLRALNLVEVKPEIKRSYTWPERS
jgi:hypothetical protein